MKQMDGWMSKSWMGSERQMEKLYVTSRKQGRESDEEEGKKISCQLEYFVGRVYTRINDIQLPLISVSDVNGEKNCSYEDTSA